jgi:excisionase family DNA binding protein
LTTEPWVTLQQVAEHLQVSEDTIHRWMQLKGMPAHRAGRYWRFKLSQVDAWIESGDAAEQKSSDTEGKGEE